MCGRHEQAARELDALARDSSRRRGASPPLPSPLRPRPCPAARRRRRNRRAPRRGARRSLARRTLGSAALPRRPLPRPSGCPQRGRAAPGDRRGAAHEPAHAAGRVPDSCRQHGTGVGLPRSALWCLRPSGRDRPFRTVESIRGSCPRPDRSRPPRRGRGSAGGGTGRSWQHSRVRRRARSLPPASGRSVWNRAGCSPHSCRRRAPPQSSSICHCPSPPVGANRCPPRRSRWPGSRPKPPRRWPRSMLWICRSTCDTRSTCSRPERGPGLPAATWARRARP